MLGTMGGNSRRGDISLIYKKGDKEDIVKSRHILFLQNLRYNPQESHARNSRCNNSRKQISCYQKKNYITHTFYHT